MHAGLPVEAGEKWACNLWFRERETASGGAAKRRMLAQQRPVGQDAGEESNGVGGVAQSNGAEASAAAAAPTPTGSSKAQELLGAPARQVAEDTSGEVAATVDEAVTAAHAAGTQPIASQQ